MANPKKNVANKRRKKQGSWLKKLLFLISVPLIVWFAAFLIWFNWSTLSGFFAGSPQQEKPVPKASRRTEPGENSESSPVKRPQEKILDEDRKKLEDILKRRN